MMKGLVAFVVWLLAFTPLCRATEQAAIQIPIRVDAPEFAPKGSWPLSVSVTCKVPPAVRLPPARFRSSTTMALSVPVIRAPSLVPVTVITRFSVSVTPARSVTITGMVTCSVWLTARCW